ncbi:50S ribosomal protein L25 [Janibacter sp. Soil728]|uniref:50S ribosomal protein L25/general stress protein Ctc n=1 Tax=Janibacter sp. Soil728 TaxID=1736393 RepID=UPI0006FB7D3A|nr:50S ribosomal protein L25/general stress protein Ctc [Janibacter sp. Soil728]KRE37498.1 50S ribosomal protein L25 [Janibacter sp. Soil728]
MAHDEIRIDSETRTQFGKGAARKLRRAEKVPAVLYGHGEAPVHLALPFHSTFQALKNPNALLTIAVEGEADQLALAKDVQRDPIKPVIEHVDLVIVKRGEKVTVEVPVHIEGDAAPETVVTVDAQTLEIEADVTNLPDNLTVSVEGLASGTMLHASDVEMPAGATLVSDPELLVVNITQQISEDELEAELADAEAEAGIEHDAPEDEAAESTEGGEESSDKE